MSDNLVTEDDQNLVTIANDYLHPNNVCKYMSKNNAYIRQDRKVYVKKTNVICFQQPEFSAEFNPILSTSQKLDKVHKKY